ncbi:unnamed protein product, partial [Didymodactylos carnosus]
MKYETNSSHFPAFTFCNINPIRIDLFSEKLNYDYQREKNRTISRWLNTTDWWKVLNTSMIKPKPISPGKRNSVEEPDDPQLSEGMRFAKNLTADEFKQALAEHLYRLLNFSNNGTSNYDQIRTTYGYKLEDMLLKCTFNGRACDGAFRNLFHPEYGNCYTFDHEKVGRQSSFRSIKGIGETNNNDYTLSLELYLHQQYYSEHLDEKAAFRAFLHRKHEVPIVAQNSLYLAPNTYSKLVFSKRIIRHVSSRASPCRKELTSEMSSKFKTNEDNVYTQALCIRFCEQLFILRYCHCIEPLAMMFFRSSTLDVNGTIASATVCN